MLEGIFDSQRAKVGHANAKTIKALLTEVLSLSKSVFLKTKPLANPDFDEVNEEVISAYLDENTDKHLLDMIVRTRRALVSVLNILETNADGATLEAGRFNKAKTSFTRDYFQEWVDDCTLLHETVGRLALFPLQDVSNAMRNRGQQSLPVQRIIRNIRNTVFVLSSAETFFNGKEFGQKKHMETASDFIHVEISGHHNGFYEKKEYWEDVAVKIRKLIVDNGQNIAVNHSGKFGREIGVEIYVENGNVIIGSNIAGFNQAFYSFIERFTAIIRTVFIGDGSTEGFNYGVSLENL